MANAAETILALALPLVACSDPAETSGPNLPASSPECGSTPEGAAPMAFIPSPGFCIDRTEVTRSQYQSWLRDGPSPDPEKLPEVCQGKTSFAPEPECMQTENVCRSGCDHRPVVCVDWCDAHAYCTAMGKRLCGAVGGDEVPFESGRDPSVSQWMSACTSGGLYDYPYGDVFDPKACNGAEQQPGCVDEGKCRARDVATSPSCRGPAAPFDGIYDLSGNVSEWEDSCDWAGSGHCRHRGGSTSTDHAWWTGLLCGFDSSSLMRITSYDYHGWDVGFRCCKEVGDS
jgi:formylglycine-generating enzyme required for sulfatase activity